MIRIKYPKLLTLSFFILIACNQSNVKMQNQELQVKSLETNMTGSFQAILHPVNSQITDNLNGSLNLVRKNDDFIADVRLSSGPRANLEIQNIHLGNECPTQKDDLNNDGFIDADEAQKVVHEIILPLDDDLSSQRMGSGIFPVTDGFGYYFWSRLTSYKKILDDLLEDDLNGNDNIAKIISVDNFTLEGKVILVAGIPTTITLPESVLGSGRLTSHQSLPIACGKIKRLTKIPGTIDSDHTGMILPEGETVGGSSGADDGAVFSESTGNYGDDNEDLN